MRTPLRLCHASLWVPRGFFQHSKQFVWNINAFVCHCRITRSISSAYIRIRSSPAYRQKATQVVIRQPGQRLLGPPEPIILTGPEDLPFALLSQAAYQRKPDAKAVNTGMCVNADAVLMGMGWKRWEGLDEGELAEKIKTVHLRVEIWWHAERQTVAVAGAVPVNTL